MDLVCGKTQGRVVSVSLPFLFALSLLTCATAAYGQQGLIINVTGSADAVEDNPLAVRASVKSLADISEALLFYKNGESTDFQQVEMAFDESSMTLNGTVPARGALAPYVEVYIRIMMRNGTVETYPAKNPTENPVRIAVKSSEGSRNILIISPERDKAALRDNFLIAASMLYAPESVDRKKTRLFLDGTDITADAVVSGDIIVYSPAKMPERISPGRHVARVVLYNSGGTERGSLSWGFNILSSGKGGAEQGFTYRGTGRVEFRNETLNDNSVWYNRGDLNFGSGVFGASLGANFHLTSEEKAYRQPQDRYGLYAATSWLRLNFGDSYPAFSNLVMNGLRVRGISGKLDAGFLRVEAAYGQTVRGIDGRYLDTTVVTATSPIQLTGASYVRLNDSTFVNANYGTYSRNLLAVRPSFGFGSNARLGFTYLKSADAISSITLGNSPAQNLVLGSDFSANFDRQRINFIAEAAISALNQNTAPGNRSIADIDSITHSDAGEQINRVIPLSTLEQFMTINEYLIPLDPRRLSSLAWDVGLSLNYFSTFARVGYVYRGPDYNSFGQPFIRTDIRGVNFFLRPRLMNNQILLSLSCESLFDNLQHNKFATTNYVNSNISASYFPMADLPNITVGFSQYANSNTLSPDSAYSVDNVTNRYFIESSYRFKLLVRHNLSAGFGISRRNDRVLLGTDLNNFNVSCLLNSDCGTIPLRTTVGFNINGNKTAQKDTSAMMIIQNIQTFNYTFITLGATYGLLNDWLSIGVNYTPTFGAFYRNSYTVTSTYRLANAQSLNLSLNYFGTGGYNDFVGYLVYDIDF